MSCSGEEERTVPFVEDSPNTTTSINHNRKQYYSRFGRWLEELFVFREPNAADDGINVEDIEAKTHRRLRRRRRQLAVVSLLAIAMAAYLRRKQQQRRRHDSLQASPAPVSLIWPMSMLIAWWKGPEYRRNPQESTMSLLWNAARDGVIQQALIGSSTIFFQTKVKPSSSSLSSSGEGTTKNSQKLQWNRAILPPNNESIKSSLLETLASGGCTDIRAIPESLSSKLATPILAALPFVYLALLYKMMKNQFGGEDISSKTSSSSSSSFRGITSKLWGDEELDRTTFADVAGLQSVVEDMAEVVSYLSNPVQYSSIGARPPRGVLLHGPPGSGKTLLTRALAGEASCDSFIALSGSAFVEMYVGRGAARVRSLFDKARKDALRNRKLAKSASWWSELLGFSSKRTAIALQERPACAIIFIDELDAVAKSRSYDAMRGNDEREQTLNALLVEMDGFDTGASPTNTSSRKEKDNRDTEEVTLIVIAASNRVDVIDPAVLRRFDRQIFVGYPDAEGRKAILKVHATKIQCGPNIDWEQLASDENTKDFSGADLRNVVNEAALFAIREKSPVVNQSHLMHAARRIGQMKTKTSNAGKPMSFPGFFASLD